MHSVKIWGFILLSVPELFAVADLSVQGMCVGSETMKGILFPVPSKIIS